MSDVFVLASPAPTLYVYPDGLHPPTPTSGGAPGRGRYPYVFPILTPVRPDDETDDPAEQRRRDEYALALLGAL